MNVRFVADPRVTTLFSSATSVSTAARAAVDAACAEGLKTAAPPAAGMVQVVAFINPDLRTKALAAAGVDDVRQALEGLAYAYVLKHTAPAAEADTATANPLGARYLDCAPAALPLSALQRQMWLEIAGAFEKSTIAIAEGSTGLGKTRVMAVAAAAAARQGERVIVAVPSVAVMTQLAQTWNALETGIEAVPMLGRGQFVDPDLVRAILEENVTTQDTRQQVEAWLASDGAPVATPLGDIPWLRDSLLHVAPEFPAEDCAHSTGNPVSLAEQCYLQLRQAATEARVVFTTHAMIAVHIRLSQLRKGEGEGLVGKIDTLLVDEAHLLEQVIGDMFSDRLSLFRLRTTLRGLDPVKVKQARGGAAVERLLHLSENAFADLGGATTGKSKNLVLNPGSELPQQKQHRAAVLALLEGIRADIKVLERLDAETAESIKALIPRVREDRSIIVVQFSPIRRFPSIAAGPRSLQQPLEAFWKSVGRAALLSATLYTPIKTGWSAGWVRNQLAIPVDRCQPMPRFLEPWVYTSPTVYLPSKGAAASLTPRADDDEKAEAAYFDAIARITRMAAVSARGGTLMLCTSYLTIEALRTRLEAEFGDRLIVQRRGMAMTKFSRLFREATNRPIWLATGPAWTGLDLADTTKAPEDDFLLTDVLLQRLPFRMAETPLQHDRIRRLGQDAIRLEAAFTFRQGIGRAVRRNGTTDRRIWVLDGRIEVSANTHLVEPCRRVLTEYPHTRRFD